MQIKTTMRYHFSPTRMVKIKKIKKTITSASKEVEKSEPSDIAGTV